MSVQPEMATYYATLRALRKARKTNGGRRLTSAQIRDFSYRASLASRAGGMPPNTNHGKGENG